MEYILSAKLTQEQIKYIDNYLQFIGVKFIDIRIELLDHLASSYENESSDISLEDFLRTKKGFVRNFEKQIHTNRHWGYQKALLKRVLKFLYSPKYLLVSTLSIITFLWLSSYQNANITRVVFLATLIVPQVLQFYIYNKPRGLDKKIQSFQYIFSIMSGPSIFLYFYSSSFEWLLETPIYFTLYWFFAFIFNVSGIIEVIECKKQILSTYKNIINT